MGSPGRLPSMGCGPRLKKLTPSKLLSEGATGWGGPKRYGEHNKFFGCVASRVTPPTPWGKSIYPDTQTRVSKFVQNIPRKKKLVLTNFPVIREEFEESGINASQVEILSIPRLVCGTLPKAFNAVHISLSAALKAVVGIVVGHQTSHSKDT